MISPYQEDLMDVYRRIAERGLRHAQSHCVWGEDMGMATQCDLWQHLLDELARFNQREIS